MPKQIITTVYTFDELSDDAKETAGTNGSVTHPGKSPKDVAREWYRDGALDYDWWDSTYEDAERIGLKITSFECYRYVEGRFVQSAVDVANNILKEHGKDCETYNTATTFLTELSFVAKEEEQENIEKDFRKSLCEDYRIMLDKEYEYLLSNECVDDAILANEYTFTINGKREG
jgi:uncharacterized protein YutE (UPF0331/DUF86 family)